MISGEVRAPIVEKLMSFTKAEFDRGIARLTGTAPVMQSPEVYDLSALAAGVTLRFDPQPDAVLGGLVRLPRVKVTLDLTALPVEDRTGFMEQFDKTFQRGGG